MSVAIAEAPVPPRSLRGPAILIGLASLIALAFFVAVAAPYLFSPSHNATQYAGRRGALVVHIACGAVALFAGPLQLWLGIADGSLSADGEIIYRAKDLKVGLFKQDAGPSPTA